MPIYVAMGNLPADSLLGTTAAAEYLGITDETLRRWAEDNKIRHIRYPSGRIKFRREDLDAVLTPVEPEDKGAA